VEKQRKEGIIMESRLQLANRLLEQAQYATAAKMFQEAYTVDEEPEALFGLALCSYQQQDYEKALRFINQLLQVEPHHSGAFNQAGVIAAEMGDLEGAKCLFIAAIEQDPTNLAAQRNYGEILLELEDYENGVQVFNKILENHPNDVPALIRLAELFEEVGRYEDAAILARKVLECDSGNEYARNLLERVSSNHSLENAE
jgi:tetratricopeptide (TPR) repeat protein